MLFLLTFTLTTSKRQGRIREKMSEGSLEQNHEPTNSNIMYEMRNLQHRTEPGGELAKHNETL